jgi:Tfp pilus assembly protein PilN
MKQEINLLQVPSGRSSRNPSARQSSAALVLAFVVGICGGFWHDFRTDSLESTVNTLNSDIDELVFSLEERSYFLAERNADPALVDELKRRQREADDKSRVLDLLSGESVGNTDGFSEHLAALGRRHPQGLWLDRIRIGDGGRQLLLRGLTTDAGLVPRFLSDLQQEPALAGTSFSSFALSTDRAVAGPLRFALATGCAFDESADEAADADLSCLPAAEVAQP